MDNTLELISDYATALQYNDLPESAIRAVKHRYIDSIGCALGAYLAEPSKIARRLCFSTESPLAARVIGSLQRTTPEMAAFANGVMVRSLDFSDAYKVKDGGHPSDAISALLAIGESVKSDGSNLITATVLAYEIECRFIEEIPLDQRGWDQPVYVVLGSTLGAGKLLGLSKEQLANAAALAVVPNIALYQSRVGELSMWKGGAAGMAARQGVFAALMAREGMTGPEEAFEGQFGLKNQVTGSFRLEPLGGNNRQFGIERTNLKAYPVRDSCQLVIKAALDLRDQIAAKEIVALHVKTYDSAYRTAVAPRQLWAPQTRETADHSMPFSIAAALIDGDVSLETFSRRRYEDPDVLDLISRMRIEEDSEFSKQAPATRNCYIEATTRGGDKVVARGVLTAEEAQRGWTDEQVEAKFLSLAYNILTPAQSRGCLNLLWRLEDLEDVSRILDHLQA
ncbi:MAG: MmgE/PrpD family protein [Pseudomonadota bacterium]